MASLRTGDGVLRKTAHASSSMVSDCYSSDEDCTEYCKDAVLNWSLDPPSVMILHEGVTNDGDQRSLDPKVICVGDERSHSSGQMLSGSSHISGLEYAHPTEDCDPPDLSGNSNISEFYRPPSRARTSCNLPLSQTDNASTIALHYSQSCAMDPSSSDYVGYKSRAGHFLSNKYESGSPFLSNSLVPGSSQGVTSGATIGLYGGGSLGSRAQSEVALGGHLQSRDELLKREDRHHSYSPGFVHSVSCRAPLQNPAIKSTSAQFSALALLEQAVQTSHLTLPRPAPSRNSQVIATGHGHVLSVVDEDDVSRHQSKVNGMHRQLLAALDTIEAHISNMCRARNERVTKAHRTDEDNVNEMYPTSLVFDLHRRIHQLEKLLDRSFGNARGRSKSARCQRRFPDEQEVRDCSPVLSGDRSSSSDNEDLEPSLNKERNEVLPDNNLQHDHTCRVFELSPYDDLVRSFQANSDRRIKAVGNKMKCVITIEGPLRIFDSSSGNCWNVRNKLAYRCVIDGTSKESVEKCLKCLQDTFPQSCLNERHFSSKPVRKISYPLS